MTSGNVSDEPIAYRDDDARERLAGIADLFLLHDRPIHTRTDDSVVRARMTIRRSRGYVPAALALPVPAGAAAARVRRGAQEHVLRRQGRAGVGVATTSATSQLGDAALLPRGDRALRAAVRGRARGRRARPAPGLPLDGVRARARRGRARRRPAPPRAPRRLPGRARRDGPGGRRRVRRHGLRPRRHGVGRRAARGRPARLRARGAPVARAAAGRRRRGPPAVADGVRVARATALGRGAGAAARALAGHVDPARWRAVARPRAVGRGGAGHDERGPAVRRGGRAVRAAHRGDLRGPGGDRARGRLRPGDHGAYPFSTAGSMPDAGRCSPRRRTSPRACRCRRRGALPRRARRGDRGGRLRGRRRAAGSTSSCSAAACSRTACCSRRTAGRLRAAGLRVLVPRALPPNDGGIAFGQAAVAAARA